MPQPPTSSPTTSCSYRSARWCPPMIIDGSLLVDQSMLTGESVPAETAVGNSAYAGGLVRRGAAIARVSATGKRTYFGRTAELVSVAHVESAEQKAVLSIVRNLTVINFVMAAGIVAYALTIGTSYEQIALLVLTVLLSAVTGTLTMNELVVSAIRPAEPSYEEADVLGYAALASSAEGQDPIDTVIRAMAANHTGWAGTRTVTRFTPFDPAVKMAEAIVV